MTPQEIEQNKQQFIALCHEHIDREGLNDLLAYMESHDFFTAPSSTRFHLNEPGGLCKHSLNVFEMAKGIYEHIIGPKIQAGESIFKKEVSLESIAVVSLFHDLCKMDFYRETEKFRKDANGRWEKYQAFEVNDIFPFGHGEKSCLFLNKYIHMTKEELLAVRWHMGMFEMTDYGTSTRPAFYAAMEVSPLVSIIQCADMLSANTLEATTKA